MVSAVDTTILIDVINGLPAYAPKANSLLREASLSGVVVICDIVYAETCGAFSTRDACDDFLAAYGISVEPLDRTSSFLASRSWISYLKSGGKRTRILPDFLIAAHAAGQADALLTRDHGFYRQHFPNLKVIEP